MALTSISLVPQFSDNSVNSILAVFVAANKPVRAKFLALSGGNASPTGQGRIDKATLISRGWNVSTS